MKEKQMSLVIKANGDKNEVQPKNGSNFSIEEMSEIVGGIFEILSLNFNRYMVVNEEGKIKDLSINEEATKICLKSGINDIIVGDVLVCDRNQIK